MGRLQKSRKHKRLKPVDAEYLNEWADKRSKRKPHVNPPPKKLDNLPIPKPKNDEDQEMPRKVRELMHLKKRTKEGKVGRRRFKKQNNNDLPQGDNRGATRPLKPVPKFIKNSDESEDAFMYRIDTQVRKVIGESQIEEQFDIDLDDGTTSVTKGKKLQKKKERLVKLRIKVNNKRKKKEFNHRDKRGDFETFKDVVEFGEVAMAPPCLTAKPRKIGEKTNYPGSKSSLLLKDMMTTKTSVPHQRAPGETLKKKHMSMAKQCIIEKERDRVINLYRQMKQQKIEKL